MSTITSQLVMVHNLIQTIIRNLTRRVDIKNTISNNSCRSFVIKQSDYSVLIKCLNKPL